jgi:hypothetical protein
MSIVSYKKLWESQLAEWPDSIRLTTYQMLEWARDGNLEDSCRKLRSLALTIQYRRCVFYLTNPEDGFIGCRFGVWGGDYQSGFGKAKLVDGKLVITCKWA